MDFNHTKEHYLECEKNWVFWVLITVGGFYGAYTFLLRGGIFCNAQTANIVLLAMALGSRDWMKALYLLIPISAYILGAVLSEFLAKYIKRFHLLRWDTILVGFEMITVVLLGFLPASAPDQICQVALNFICSMQYNTFRQAEGIPMATTFCTNHIRQIGINLVIYRRHRRPETALRLRMHLSMLGMFIAGGVASTLLCEFFGLRAIWGAAVLLLIVFIRLCRADLVFERDLLSEKPRGH
ncbi:MAG: DUF1275 domain-containing protein [Eubacterium sp.]|nr:DUF1275 domain-containing protein [Eubacterium sp.]